MTRHPFRYALAGIALLVFCASHAYAQGGVPISTATTATDAGLSLVTQYGPIWGGMLLVFGVASSLLAQNQSTHWIAQGRTLAAIVAGVGVFASVLQTHFGDGEWSGVVVTLVVAVFKLVNPIVPVTPATVLAQAVRSQGGFATRWLMGYLAAFGLVVGCASWFHTAASDGLQCAEVEQGAIAKGESIVAEAIQVGTALVALAAGNAQPLEGLIVAWGEPICACLSNDLLAAHAPTATDSSAVATTPDATFLGAQKAIAIHHWTYATKAGAK